MKKRHFQNKLIAELLSNCQKVPARCPHFLDCGGCSYQDFTYGDQIKVKEKKLKELFGDLTADTNVSFQGGQEYGYRTRMDYIVSSQGLGLRRKRRFDQVVDLHECHLIDPAIFGFLRSIYEEGIKIGLIPYDLQSKTGFWRYLSVRVNEKNDFMVIVNTTSDEKLYPLVDELIEKITNNIVGAGFSRLQLCEKGRENPARTKVGNLVSIYHLINDGLNDDNFGEVRRWWGEEFLKFKILNPGSVSRTSFKFKIGPNTFFQNSIELLNGLITKLVGYIDADDQVLDLYCGVGTLSLPVAKKAKQVLGVELMAESIELAKLNAIDNGITNVDFVVGEVEKIITNDELRIRNYDALVLDPPRKGLEKAASEIMEMDLQKIVYMSCNPLTLKKDLEVLTKKYRLVEASWWDLYPQTPHVEGLCLLVGDGVEL
ncbi:MAG: methyltransferase domain-containing protein [Patescibacteria group bacterium]